METQAIFALAFWQLDRIDSFNDLIYILGQGLRVDIATLCGLTHVSATLKKPRDEVYHCSFNGCSGPREV